MSIQLFLPFNHAWSLLLYFSQICSFTLHLKFLKSTPHLIYRILTLHETIIISNKILFKFEDNKKQILF